MRGEVGAVEEQKITIAGSSGLNKDDVARMVKDAEAHATEDKARRELIDARNQADSLAYSVEKTITDHRDRLPATDVSQVESAIAAVREATKDEDLASIRAASDELQKGAHGLAEQLYKQSQANAANAAAPGNENDVKEGEVVA